MNTTIAGLIAATLLALLAYAARAIIARHWRAVLPRLPLPTLALAASYGVYSFALLFVPTWVAIVQAAAFELTYIGLAAATGLGPAQRKRAAAIGAGAVGVSIIYNTLAGLFHRNPAWLDNLQPGAEWGLAILHGAPLAWVAYLVAELLLHSEPAQRPRIVAQRRALVRRLVAQLRSSRQTIAQLGAGSAQEVAQLRDQLASAHTYAQAAAQWQGEAERLRAQLAQLAQTTQESAQVGDLDVAAIARRLVEAGVGPREAGRLVGRSESTVRSWAAKPAQASRNGVQP